MVNGYFLPPAQAVTPGIRDEEIILVKQNPTVYKLFEYYLHDSKYLLGAQLYRVCIYTLTRQDDGSYKRSINEFSYDDCIRIITQSQYLTDRTHYEKLNWKLTKRCLPLLMSFHVLHIAEELSVFLGMWHRVIESTITITVQQKAQQVV